MRLYLPGWGSDPNWFMIRPSRAHTRVFPDQNYRVWTEVRAHYSLDDGLEMVWSEVVLVWKVWTMVWRWSDQRSIWSEKSDHRQIRAQLGLIKTSSSALGSDQKCFRTQLGLIRDKFECLIFFFFCFLLRDFGFVKRQQ